MVKGQFGSSSSAQLGPVEASSPQLRPPKFLPVDQGGAPCHTTIRAQRPARPPFLAAARPAAARSELRQSVLSLQRPCHGRAAPAVTRRPRTLASRIPPE